jgi:FKBP-type peptidyl-prolyl cis-trans isomerase SlyD
MNRAVSRHTIVTLHLEIKDGDGLLLQSTRQGNQPLVYLHGTGSLLRGLERQLEGRQVGESFQVLLSPAEAYGESRPELIQTVPKALFEGMELYPGMIFNSQSDGGGSRRVIQIENDQVTLDANHPLAGKPLQINGEILIVRQATPLEIELGVRPGSVKGGG